MTEANGRVPLLLALAGVFAPLSLVTVGGGQTVIGEIGRQVVDVHHWLTAQQFLTDFAIARVAPGPGSLLATLIGWQVGGVWGAIVATVGIFGPSALLIYGMALAWHRSGDALWQRVLQGGLRPVAAGMILASALVLVQALDGGWPAVAVALVSTTLLLVTAVNPLVLIAGGGALLAGLHLLGMGA